MKAEKLSENLFFYKNTCNVYIIKDGKKALLIDCGDGSILNILSSLDVEKIEMVFFTHHHRDQCQGAHKLATHGCKIHVPEYELSLFSDSEAFWSNRHIYDNYNTRSTINTVTRNIHVTSILEDYKEYFWRGYRFKVLPTPGHTLGSIALIVEIDGEKCIFCGDMMREGGKLQNLYDLQPSYGGWEGVDQLYSSIVTIQRENPDLICPSHGDVIDNPNKSLDTLKINLHDWYQWCKEGVLTVLDKENYPFDSPHFPSDFTPCILTDHLIAFPNACCTFYAIIADSGKAFFIDYGAAGWSHFWSHLTFRESWETQRFMEHSIVELKNKFGLNKIEVVMPTHYHDDHVHGIPHLVEHYNTEVWCIDKIADVLEHPENYALMCLFNKPIQVNRRLSHGEVFNWRGFEFKVWHYPGQTEYHQLCMLKIDGKKILFTGDSLFTGGINGKCMASPLIFRNYHRFESHMECAEILVTLEPDLIAPGHGPVFHVTKDDLMTFKYRSQKLQVFFNRLLPESEKWAGIDPFWVRFIPYQLKVKVGESFNIEVHIRNFKDKTVSAGVRLELPMFWISEPMNQHIKLNPNGETWTTFKISVPEEWNGPSRLAIVADIILDDVPIGQVAEAIIHINRKCSY